MTKRMTQVVVAGVFAAILAIGAGAAIASGGLGNDRQAFLNDVAKRLNVTPEQLTAALQGAAVDQIDAAVAAGKITKAQGDAMKQRAVQGGLPFFGGGHRGGFWHGGFGHGDFGHGGPMSLSAAASYLGLSEAELRTQLDSGTSLAQVAKDKGKSVDGLKTAITDQAKQTLDAAVKGGHLTQAEADQMLAGLTQRLDMLVNGTGGPHAYGYGEHGFGAGGPPRGMPFGGAQGGGEPQGSGGFTPVPA